MNDSLLDLAELRDSWLMELRAERKSKETLKAYRLGVDMFLAFCDDEGLPPELTKKAVVQWVASMADTHESASARLRLTAVKLFARWLADEEEFDADPITAVRPPKLDQKVVEHVSDRGVQAMIVACEGKELRDRRDKALIVLFTETGVRSEEMLSMAPDDVSLADCSATVRRGKGAKGRRVRFSQQAAAVLDKYMRARRRAGYGDSDPLWVSPRGGLSYTGMKSALKRRAQVAGVAGFHPHRLRHTSAVRWLTRGGSETGLMAQGGWASRNMIDRYVKSAREQIASDEFDRLGLAFDP